MNDKNNYEVERKKLLEQLKLNGCGLDTASEELKNDKEIVLEAVKNNSLAIEFASKELKCDKEVILEAAKNNEWILDVFDLGYKNIEELIV